MRSFTIEINLTDRHFPLDEWGAELSDDDPSKAIEALLIVTRRFILENFDEELEDKELRKIVKLSKFIDNDK